MGQVIAMPEKQCEDALALLPWHVAGTLDADDRAVVERHLTACADCRRELEVEGRLKALVAADDAGAADGWHAVALALDREELAGGPLPPLPAARPARDRRRGWAAAGRMLSDPRRLRWIAGAQFAALLALGTAVIGPLSQGGGREAPYRALGDAPAADAARGNVLAMFRPDASEAALRRALTASGARLVNGPTEAGAWVLAVPGGADGAPLARLRSQHDVTMAEPIGEGPSE